MSSSILAALRAERESLTRRLGANPPRDRKRILRARLHHVTHALMAAEARHG